MWQLLTLPTCVLAGSGKIRDPAAPEGREPPSRSCSYAAGRGGCLLCAPGRKGTALRTRSPRDPSSHRDRGSRLSNRPAEGCRAQHRLSTAPSSLSSPAPGLQFLIFLRFSFQFSIELCPICCVTSPFSSNILWQFSKYRQTERPGVKLQRLQPAFYGSISVMCLSVLHIHGPPFALKC